MPSLSCNAANSSIVHTSGSFSSTAVIIATGPEITGIIVNDEIIPKPTKNTVRTLKIPIGGKKNMMAATIAILTKSRRMGPPIPFDSPFSSANPEVPKA